MIKDAYKETLKMLKALGQVILVFSVIALVAATFIIPTIWLVETYFYGNFFCAVFGTIIDFVLGVFILNLIFAYLDKKVN